MKSYKLCIPLFFSVNSYAFYANEDVNETASEFIAPIMVTIPAGSFKMRDIDEEDAQPIRKVTLSEFSLGKYEVTVKEFRHFVEQTGYKMPSQCTHKLNGWFNYGKTDGTWENNSLNTILLDYLKELLGY